MHTIALHERLAGDLGNGMAVNGCLQEHGGRSSVNFEHSVQFYEKDEFLVEALGAFCQEGFGLGEGAIVIATQSHHQALTEWLTKRGIDVAAAQAEGRYAALDAGKTLAKIMVDGRPDRTRFHGEVGGLLDRMSRTNPRVRAFGEMVALLWAEGNGAAAILLEELWNGLRGSHPLSVLCAYPLNAFRGEARQSAFLSICRQHGRVLPAETYGLHRASEEDRLRTIALLQQKAASLEAEMEERRRAEEALRLSEERFRQLISLMPAAVYTCDCNGRLTYFNRRAAELWGREPALGEDEVKFCGSIRLWMPDGSPLPHDQTPVAEALERGLSTRNREVVIERPDGSRIHASVNIDPLYDANGGRCGAINVFQDITEIKEAEKALQATHDASRRLAAIVACSDDAIIGKDLNGTIMSWNRGAERIFGYKSDEVIGQPVTILMPPDRVDEEPEILKQIRNGQTVDHYETIRRRKDGTRINISLTVSPIKDFDGRVIGISKIARDITEKVQARERLETMVAERTAQLRDAVAELEAFSYSIAHDMRAPLRAMNSYARFLEEDYAGRLPLQGREFLRRISSSASRLDSLIRDVLNYSKVSRGEMPLERIDLERLIREIIDSYAGFHDAGAMILVQSPMPPVLGNPAALTQCISNLLSNAVKFVCAGRTPHVRVSAERKGERVRVWVEDNGIGIPAENLDRVFQMFQRLNPANEFEGTGIGLTIVRKAVERMGGQVGIESQPGLGSRFWFELKLAAE